MFLNSCYQGKRPAGLTDLRDSATLWGTIRKQKSFMSEIDLSTDKIFFGHNDLNFGETLIVC